MKQQETETHETVITVIIRVSSEPAPCKSDRSSRYKDIMRTKQLQILCPPARAVDRHKPNATRNEK